MGRKAILEARLQRLETKKADLVKRSDASEDINEVRSITEKLREIGSRHRGEGSSSRSCIRACKDYRHIYRTRDQERRRARIYGIPQGMEGLRAERHTYPC